MIKNICPNCEKVTNLELIRCQDTLRVRGELIEIEDQFFNCLECGEEFEHPQSTQDALVLAYQEYRHRYGMLQPDEIRAWRKKYNLTQKELNSLLTWKVATLSRYEQGDLQDDAHEKIIRLVMDSRNFRHLIQHNQQILSDEKREKLLKEIAFELRI